MTEPCITENELLALCKDLYRRWMADTDRAIAEGLPDTTMKEFVTWVLDNELLTGEEGTAVSFKLSCRPSAVEYLQEVFNDPWSACQHLYFIWPAMSLQHRPLPNPGVRFIHVATTIGFTDGLVAQLQGSYPVEPGSSLGDGFICALLQDFNRSMTNTLAHVGMQGMHDTYAAEPAQSEEELKQRPVPPAPPRNLGW